MPKSRKQRGDGARPLVRFYYLLWWLPVVLQAVEEGINPTEAVLPPPPREPTGDVGLRLFEHSELRCWRLQNLAEIEQGTQRWRPCRWK